MANTVLGANSWQAPTCCSSKLKGGEDYKGHDFHFTVQYKQILKKKKRLEKIYCSCLRVA